MSKKIEIFSAGCPACQATIDLVNSIVCENCEVFILDMNDSNTAQRAKDLNIFKIPAVVIDGKLADCCQGKAPTKDSLRAAGIGR